MGQLHIYIVRGEVGKYADEYDQWDVACYTSREQAGIHCTRLRQAQRGEGGVAAISELDPTRRGFRDSRYEVVELPLFAHLDEYLEAPAEVKSR